MVLQNIAELQEFKRRMEDEHKRINHRLTDLEETVRQIGELTTSVHSLAQSVEQLVKSQNRQESRLEELENRDGDTWRKVKWYLLTLAIGAVFARKGWNGKKQYIQLATGISYTFEGKVINCEHESIGNKAIAFVGTSGVQMGWLASQADMLAEDWVFVE